MEQSPVTNTSAFLIAQIGEGNPFYLSALMRMETLKGMEQIADAIGFVYSRSGFTKPGLTMLKDHHIAYSDDER